MYDDPGDPANAGTGEEIASSINPSRLEAKLSYKIYTSSGSCCHCPVSHWHSSQGEELASEKDPNVEKLLHPTRRDDANPMATHVKESKDGM
jgi:hypothetical protein